jgi:hypothetical protein
MKGTPYIIPAASETCVVREITKVPTLQDL